jgi:hypothetical protein
MLVLRSMLNLLAGAHPSVRSIFLRIKRSPEYEKYAFTAVFRHEAKDTEWCYNKRMDPLLPMNQYCNAKLIGVHRWELILPQLR